MTLRILWLHHQGTAAAARQLDHHGLCWDGSDSTPPPKQKRKTERKSLSSLGTKAAERTATWSAQGTSARTAQPRERGREREGRREEQKGGGRRGGRPGPHCCAALPLASLLQRVCVLELRRTCTRAPRAPCPRHRFPLRCRPAHRVEPADLHSRLLDPLLALHSALSAGPPPGTLPCLSPAPPQPPAVVNAGLPCWAAARLCLRAPAPGSGHQDATGN